MADVLERARGVAVVVAFRGEIDIATADGIRTAADLAARSGYDSLVADLSAVTFMDCQGVNAIVSASALLRQQGGELVVQRPSPQVEALLRLCDVDETVRIEHG